jgi:mannose-6-phosphate isomerase-like protein (cupin superfamily)
MNKRINIAQKLSLFKDLWTPKIIDEFNGQQLKLAKVKGEFVWHDHKNEDELFLVIKGCLSIEFKDKTVEINAGELFLVPKGVKHRPFALEETHILLIEPSTTRNTGEINHDLSVEKPEWI